jgi:hypothetical protein
MNVYADTNFFTFWSFNKKANKLAKLAGLEVIRR